jgi:hypothetical protein
MQALSDLLKGMRADDTKPPETAVGPGAQAGQAGGDVQNILRTVLGGLEGGGSPIAKGTDMLKAGVRRAVLKEVESEFKKFLQSKGVSSSLLGSISLDEVLKKTAQLKNLTDDQIWGGLKKVMTDKAGLNSEVSDMVINVMKENGVSFEDLKKIAGDEGIGQETLKEALKVLNPRVARLMAENPGCLRIFDLFKENNALSMQDVLQVAAECQRAKEAWAGVKDSDSDGELSDQETPLVVDGRDRRNVLASDSEEDEEDEDEDEDEEDEEDEEEEEEEEEEDEEEEEEDEEEEEEDEEEKDEGKDEKKLENEEEDEDEEETVRGGLVDSDNVDSDIVYSDTSEDDRG